jgi:hypothetical protein
MDINSMFNAVLSLVAFLGGWIIKYMHSEVTALKEDLKRLPDTYARKDDVKDKFDMIQSTLSRIETKLDNKKDKGDV